MSVRLRLCSLSYHGPFRKPAVVTFKPGMNVIYGASNTGKSFIVDTIDFMLGGKGPLRDIPERVGYKHVLLGMETTAGDQFTIGRAVDGGPFVLYEGLFAEEMPSIDGKVLADQHSDRRDDNLSAFLLEKLGLAHKRVRRNKKGDTNSLSFRNVARLVVINEEEIIQQRSPLSDGGYGMGDTANTSVFKLLLTGVDDTSLAAAKTRSPEDQTRDAQILLLDQLIADYRKLVKDLAGSDELQEQLDKLEATMEGQSEQLAISEAGFRTASTERRDLARRVEEGRNRLAEITVLLERFLLLGAHYRSDLARLEAIAEAGTLFGALGEVDCPLCGAAPDQHKQTGDCEGNASLIAAAACADIAKITSRQADLDSTVDALRNEAVQFERRLPRLEERLTAVAGEIDRVVAPNLKQLRSSYRQLADKTGEVREGIAVHRGLLDFEDRKAKLEREMADGSGSSSTADVDLSTSTADRFATIVRDVLKAWHFPGVDRVHFDMKVRDLVINGKARTSFGKGLRAITQTAFSTGLLEYCVAEKTPHPGFLVVDSPLLSYREPEGAADDLRSTDLNDHFYSYFESWGSDRQVLIVENTDPPANVKASPQAVMFTGIEGLGRAGLFPAPQAASEEPAASD